MDSIGRAQAQAGEATGTWPEADAETSSAQLLQGEPRPALRHQLSARVRAQEPK